MCKVGVLLISGFHFVEEELGVTTDLSLFQKNEDYYQKLENSINDAIRPSEGNSDKKALTLEGIKIEYIIFLGDSSFSGRSEEFNQAKRVLNDLARNFNVKKQNVLILPGNHDVEREELRSKQTEYKKKHKTLLSYEEQQEVKLKSFQEFYDSFYADVRDDYTKDKICFDFNDAICRTMYSPEMGVVFLGINSAYKESYNKNEQVGYINIDKLKSNLQQISEKYTDKKIIALMHHKMDGFAYGEADKIENWKACKPIFEKYNISSFIFGGGATSDGVRVTQNETCEYYVSGSLSDIREKKYNRYNLLYYSEENPNKLLKINSFVLVSQGEKDYYWEHQTGNSNTIDRIVIEKITGQESIDMAMDDVPTEDSPMDSEPAAQNKEKLEKEKQKTIEDDIIKTIKDNNLYMLGIFKWDPKGESISYIQMDYFYENYECFENVKSYYKGILDKNNILPDLVIGYEMNGNMIGTLLAVEKQCDYSYLPADDKNHIQPERELPEEQYEKIAVILDIVFTKNLIVKITRKIKKSYPQVKEIYFISLIEGIKTINSSFTNKERLDIDECDNISIFAYSVCQIPLITTAFNQKNNEFFKQQVIPVYHLYSDKKKTLH